MLIVQTNLSCTRKKVLGIWSVKPFRIENTGGWKGTDERS